MKKYLICFLLLSFILSSYSIYAEEKPSYTDGQKQGESEASRASTTTWTLIGCGSTCLFSTIGCLGSTALGYLLSPSAPFISSDKGDEYARGFKDSYASKVKQKRATSACVGGSIMTLLQILFAIPVYLIWGASIIALLNSLN